MDKRNIVCMGNAWYVEYDSEKGKWSTGKEYTRNRKYHNSKRTAKKAVKRRANNGDRIKIFKKNGYLQKETKK